GDLSGLCAGSNDAMSRILINALASTAGGGITYLRNVLPRLERRDKANQYFVLTPSEGMNGQTYFESGRVIIEPMMPRGGAIGRMLWGQDPPPAFFQFPPVYHL